MAAINPYLTFKDNCEEAFNFYKNAFGKDFAQLIRFKDMPMEGQPAPPNIANQIMHVSLPIGDGTVLMGSDAPEGFGPPVQAGNNFSISINTTSEEEATKIFNAMSNGGRVSMPLGKAPWGAYFGMFTDKFGVNWMVNYDYNKN